MYKKSITAADLFLAILAVLLISVSFYQTWIGLEQIFGPASFIIALVLSLLLLFLCWMLRAAKVEGRSTTSLIWIYIFIASFCFIANFNALYTRFMRTNIYASELRSINAKFNGLETDVEAKLNYSFNPSLSRNIDTEKKKLMIQIVDPGNPGIGMEALNIIRGIEKLTGKKITLLKPVGKDYSELATRMGEQIDDMIAQLSPDEKNLKEDIENAVLKWNKEIQSLLLLSKKEIDDMAQGLIDKALNDYNKLGNRAHAVLGEGKFKFEEITSNTQDVGKIGYAFEHAVKNFGMYQFVVLAGCILLDFVIVIIVLLVTNVDSGINNKSVIKRTGRTLIPNN